MTAIHRRAVCGLTLATVILTGCTTTVVGTPRAASQQPNSTSTVPLPPPDPTALPLRPVPMPTGTGIAYLLRETTAQVLCQAISDKQWADIIGSAVRREPSQLGRCVVRGGGLNVELSTDSTLYTKQTLMRADLASADPIQGLPAKAEANKRMKRAAVWIAAMPEVNSEETRQQYAMFAHPTLVVEVKSEQNDVDLDRMFKIAKKIAENLVAAVAKPGQKFPVPVDLSAIPFSPMPPVPRGQITDAPGPFIALQLCTAITEVLHIDPNHEPLRPLYHGSCVIDSPDLVLLASIDEGDTVEGGSDTVAGRPAILNKNGFTLVLLRDDSPAVLSVLTQRGAQPTAPDLADKLVHRLLAG